MLIRGRLSRDSGMETGEQLGNRNMEEKNINQGHKAHNVIPVLCHLDHGVLLAD
jgi:hypothetical protein